MVSSDKMKTNKLPPCIISLFFVISFSAGCKTTTLVGETPPSEAIELKRGDSVDTLIAQMGEPEKKSILEKEGSSGEVWTYRHQMRSKNHLVPTGTRQVPVYDRLTEETIMVPETVYSSEISDIDLVTEILVMDGRVISWKQRVDEVRTLVE